MVDGRCTPDQQGPDLKSTAPPAGRGRGPGRRCILYADRRSVLGGTFEHRHRLLSARSGDQPQARVGRVGRLLRGGVLRRCPRHRVQRGAGGRRGHRRLPPVQVHRPRTRRAAPHRPRHHAGRHEARRRPGLLHALVRRARQGDRRRDRDAAHRGLLSDHGGRSQLSMVRPERHRPGRGDPRRVRDHRRARPAGQALPRGAGGGDAPGVGRREVLPPAQERDRRRRGRCDEDGVHRRPGLRALGRRRGGARRLGCGVRGGRAVRHPPGRDPRPRRVSRGGRPHPDRGRLHERTATP